MDENASKSWLQRFYYTRGLVAAAWVAGAFTLGKVDPVIAAALLIAYPAWDALANWMDARNSGGLGRNPSQAVNVAVSTVTAIAVAVAVGHSMNAVLSVFGIWASLAGILQLVTGVRRWRSFGAQWAMILSGAQSALAGGFFVAQSLGTATPGIATVAPYAGFGAFYFLLSAVLLTISSRRRGAATA
jgi:hypothetical protein